MVKRRTETTIIPESKYKKVYESCEICGTEYVARLGACSYKTSTFSGAKTEAEICEERCREKQCKCEKVRYTLDCYEGAFYLEARCVDVCEKVIGEPEIPQEEIDIYFSQAKLDDLFKKYNTEK